jgi:hypothetical protein
MLGKPKRELKSLQNGNSSQKLSSMSHQACRRRRHLSGQEPVRLPVLCQIEHKSLIISQSRKETYIMLSKPEVE